MSQKCIRRDHPIKYANSYIDIIDKEIFGLPKLIPLNREIYP
jgi:hypothetical protein